MPDQTLPLVVSLAHSADAVPPELAAGLALRPDQVADNVDAGAAEVAAGLPVRAVVRYPFSRLVADPNRAPEDLGPKGVVAAADYHGRPVFLPHARPDRAEMQRRVARYYRPFHAELARALAAPGVRGLIDLHSLDGVGPAEAPDPGRRRAQVVLGDRQGRACPPRLTQSLAAECRARGLSAAVNQPYAGGHLAARYGKELLARGGFALQVELNKDLLLVDGAVDPDRAAEVARRLSGALAAALAALPAPTWL
jgi:N-formylglutamate amidohydrolase